MRLSTGMRIGQWDLNIDDFLQINTILPLLSEQQSIATYLNQKMWRNRRTDNFARGNDNQTAKLQAICHYRSCNQRFG